MGTGYRNDKREEMMREDEPAVFSARGEEPVKEKEESLIREMRHTEG